MRTKKLLAAELTGGRWNSRIARKALAAWEGSGMSGSAFARANGLNAQRLFWWRKQLGGEAPAVAPLTFIPATTAATTSTTATARVLVRLPGGVEIEATEAEALPATWVVALARELSRTA